jgi:hypothetical protein
VNRFDLMIDCAVFILGKGAAEMSFCSFYHSEPDRRSIKLRKRMEGRRNHQHLVYRMFIIFAPGEVHH